MFSNIILTIAYSSYSLPRFYISTIIVSLSQPQVTVGTEDGGLYVNITEPFRNYRRAVLLNWKVSS